MAFQSDGATSATTSVAKSAQKLLVSLSVPRISSHQLQRAQVDEGKDDHDGEDSEGLLDEHLDVHQPVADQRRGERQRHAAQEHGRVFGHRRRRGQPEAARRRAARTARLRPSIPRRSSGAAARPSPIEADEARASSGRVLRQGTPPDRRRQTTRCGRARPTRPDHQSTASRRPRAAAPRMAAGP